jgi:multidrug efflux pump subunit AcrB
MKSLIRWTIRNTPAMNTLMVAIMAVGVASLLVPGFRMYREIFPEFELEILQVVVPYPGATPEEVEEGICQKIEEAVQSIAGIKKLNSMSREGSGTVVLELESDVPDVQKILNEVRSEIDRIPSFPELAEDPKITQITLRNAAIRVGVMGPDIDGPRAEIQLREEAERIRRELLLRPSVSQAEIIGGRDYQIDIEIPEATLRKYGLTLQKVADIVRRENIELPGGKIRTNTQEVLLRGKNKQLSGPEIAKIPLVTDSNGVVLTVGDLGTVSDEFVDTTAISRINGRPGLVISVNKTADEDLLLIVDEVRQYLDEIQHERPNDHTAGPKQLPPGYRVATWMDRSVMVFDRMDLLGRNGLQGLLLVFLVLAVFLERRLAFWVALGIPISMLGACAILLAMGQTLNMLSMFAFLMVLGILVDDAIVVGENVYTHRQMGKGFVAAAVDGTYEVLPSVLASVTTTIIAFVPLLFVPGVMGKFIAVMPLAVIVMLMLSLFESTFILPCHLAHSGEHAMHELPWWVKLPWTIAGIFVLFFLFAAKGWWEVSWITPIFRDCSTFWQLVIALPVIVVALLPLLWYPLMKLGHLLGWVNQRVSQLLQTVIQRVYLPTLRYSLGNPAVVFTGCVATLALAVVLVISRWVPFNAFPKLDFDNITAKITYPDGTSAAIARQASDRLNEAIEQIDNEYRAEFGRPLVLIRHQGVGAVNMTGDIQETLDQSGSHIGSVSVELVRTDQREWSSQQVINKWRERAEQLGGFPGAENQTFGTVSMGPGGAPIEFKLLAGREDMEHLEQAVEKAKKTLESYAGVFDIRDDSAPGKDEFQITVKDDAKAMGLTLADIAGTVRASYYGEEVMRLQRGRHEVKLMVRYPPEERRSLVNFDDIRIRGLDGAERPITELADIRVDQGYSQIMRLDQMRAITITADVDEEKANARNIVDELKSQHVPGILAEYPAVSVRWEGQAEQTHESILGLLTGLGIALVVMFGLLTFEFRSYIQPLLILVIIPFGAVGAVVGHLVLQIPITLFSLFGMVALTGVVINDSIVLIDFINRRVRGGVPLKQALLDAGARRFRPVMLTSLTTIAGLLPILTETSLQAQVVIPMAASLAFGLLFTTVLVLVLVPTVYEIYARAVGVGTQPPEVPDEPPLPTEKPVLARVAEHDEDELGILSS